MCSTVGNCVKYTISWTRFWVGIFGDADTEKRGLLTLKGMRISSRVAISNAMAAKLPWPISCYDEHPTKITKNHRHPPSRQFVYTIVLEAMYGARHSAKLLLIKPAWSWNVCHRKREQCSRKEQNILICLKGTIYRGSGKLSISPVSTSRTSQHD
jgi:hypothetical protein